MVSSHLRKHGIDAVLVGGACVSIYTENKYFSFDIDYVTFSSIRKIKPILKEIGFQQKSSRHFEHEGCPLFIEFPAPPIALGNECPVVKFNNIKTMRGIVKLLTPTDCVKDRLAAYFHWNDPQSLKQAIMVAQLQKVNLKEIKKWAEREGGNEKYKIFADRL